MAKSIEISTAHNIVVYFDLAPLVDRIIANVIDLVIVGIVWVAMVSFLSMLTSTVISQAVALILVGTYHLFFEIFNNGQSPGKKLLKIKVVNLKGVPPNPNEAFQRWIFRMVDVTFSAGSLASLFIASSPKNQRLGDIIAGCTVIKLKKTNNVTLERILKIQNKEREVVYPGVIRFKENEMLLVKEILMRHNKFKNVSTKKALSEVSTTMAKALDIYPMPLNHPRFLEDILKDYVSLTR